MQKGTPDYKSWYPLWIDKWLWGSTRLELILTDKNTGEFLDLRGIYLDLLTLSKKDGGFIRANQTTPYPHTQLAGMFGVPIEKLDLCINICLDPRVDKLRETSPGIYFIPSTADYELTERHKRRFETNLDKMSTTEDIMSANTDTMSEKAVTIIDKRREENKIGKDNKSTREEGKPKDSFSSQDQEQDETSRQLVHNLRMQFEKDHNSEDQT